MSTGRAAGATSASRPGTRHRELRARLAAAIDRLPDLRHGTLRTYSDLNLLAMNYAGRIVLAVGLFLSAWCVVGLSLPWLG